MNRALELQKLDQFTNENYFEPAKNWPRYEAMYRSCCRWALDEIRKEFAARPQSTVLDILSDLYAEMEAAMAGADECARCNGITPTPALVFSVGREMTEIVAGLYL